MAVGSQYEEDAFLANYFGSNRGFVVDVGAADGIDNSNSYALIQSGWDALLIEPVDAQYQALSERYKNNMGVIPFQCVITDDPGVHTLYVSGQVSTLHADWRDGCIKQYGVEYHEQRVVGMKLSFLLENLEIPEIDFLTVDTELHDQNVLNSLDFGRWQPRLICTEVPVQLPSSYHQIHRTSGNLFYEYAK